MCLCPCMRKHMKGSVRVLGGWGSGGLFVCMPGSGHLCGMGGPLCVCVGEASGPMCVGGGWGRGGTLCIASNPCWE